MGLQIIETGDGSPTLFDAALDEVYHSRNGALSESMHVFIRAGWEVAAGRFRRIDLLEVGFGTGMNALLTAISSSASGTEARYLALEPHPVGAQITGQLNYPAGLGGGSSAYWAQIHATAWEGWEPVHESFHLLKSRRKVEEYPMREGQFNLVYFDAFSPRVQPDIWSCGIFKKLHAAMQDNGILVTYCARGEVRRNLQQSGFTVERLPGPKGKREMLRATKPVSG